MLVLPALAVTALVFVLSVLAQTPKEVLPPKLLRQLQDPQGSTLQDVRDQLKAMNAQHGAERMELAALNQHIADLEKQIAADRQELNSMDPARELERIVRLEDYVAEQTREALKLANEAKTSRESLMSWMRLIFAAVLGLGLNEGWKRWKDKRRRALQSAVINTKLSTIHEDMHQLETNTNDKMDQLLKVTGESEYAKGKLEGQGER